MQDIDVVGRHHEAPAVPDEVRDPAQIGAHDGQYANGWNVCRPSNKLTGRPATCGVTGAPSAAGAPNFLPTRLLRPVHIRATTWSLFSTTARKYWRSRWAGYAIAYAPHAIVYPNLHFHNYTAEAITGQDLVAWQLRVASGERMPFTQEQVHFEGYAIEVRLYAEDAYAGFLPQTGRIDVWRPAGGPGIHPRSTRPRKWESPPHTPLAATDLA